MNPRIVPYRLITQRLVIRCWKPTDAQELVKTVLANLEHLRPWMPWAIEENITLEKYLPHFRQWRAKFDLDQEYVFGIFNLEESRLLGGCGLHNRVGDEALEIGYWIDKDHTNQGLISEASAALIRVVFELFQMKRIEIHCDPLNLASAAVPRKLGFTHEATLLARSTDYYGKPSDSMIWSLFAEQYPGSPAALAQVQAFNAFDETINWRQNE